MLRWLPFPLADIVDRSACWRRQGSRGRHTAFELRKVRTARDQAMYACRQRPLVSLAVMVPHRGNGSIINVRGVSDSPVWPAGGRARDRVSRSSSRFPRKDGRRVVQRLADRDHQILMAESALPDDRATAGVDQVAHELKAGETDRSSPTWSSSSKTSSSSGPGVVYQWIGNRKDWRGQGHFRRPHRSRKCGPRHGLDGDHRQDQESLLRDAEHAGAAGVRRDSLRSPPGRLW